jgi:hypothetical protein
VAQSANARTARSSTSLQPPPAGDKACQRAVSTGPRFTECPAKHKVPRLRSE